MMGIFGLFFKLP